MRSPVRSHDSATLLDGGVGLALGYVALRLYQASSPAVVNPDGLGYLKQMAHNFAAGHLLYLPLLRAATAASGGVGLRGGLALSAWAGAIAVVLCFACARSLVGRREATLAAAGLAVSYGVWVQGADVEVYACSLVALLATFALGLAYRARPSLVGALATGVALGVSVMFHLTHVIATPFAVILIATSARDRRQGLVHGAVAAITGGALSLGGYAWAAIAVRHAYGVGAVRWILTAQHGFPYEGGPLDRIADATYGLARALVFSPYLSESNAQHLLGQFLVGLTAAAVLVGCAIAGRDRLRALPRAGLAAWVGAYATMALAFFGSDHERWIFVLPPLWIVAAAGASSLRRGPILVAGAVVALFFVNRATAIEPAIHETWDRTRADAAASVMSDGDLVIFPGHGWDEYIGFYTDTRVDRFPVAYYAGLLGRDASLARLERDIGTHMSMGNRVFVVRLLDDPPPENDARGFYELSALGLPREAIAEWLRRYQLTAIPTRESKVTVWQLAPK